MTGDPGDAADLRRPPDLGRDADPRPRADLGPHAGPGSEAEASLARTAAQLGLGEAVVVGLRALLAALVREVDPPTTVRDPSAAADAHVADSLSALQVARVGGASRIVDIGSGAGFPGLPLAVALPTARVDLLEASRRKCEVIARLAHAAEASRARAVAERAETWACGEGREAYELVTARAVANLAVLAEYAAPLLGRGGALLAWKGRRDADEEAAGARAAGRLGLAYEDVLPVTPFPGARARHLHVMVKRESTPPEYPRRPGRAVKRPLG